MNTLFGLVLAPLFVAIAQVESNDGAASDNVYQIAPAYVDDVNRILGEDRYAHDDVKDRAKSQEMMEIYWRFYGTRYRRSTGLEPTAEVLARMHNGGPNGWRVHATEVYWHKVKDKLEEEG